MVKTGADGADTGNMIISEEQVQRVLAYLHTQNEPVLSGAEHFAEAADGDLVERVRHELERFPETRGDRVAMGRELIATHAVSSDEVAAKMIGRIISDSMR